MKVSEQIWTVSEVNAAVRDIIEGSLMPIWVGGEVGNLTIHSSGHVYMTLKDASSQIKTVFFGGAAQCRQLGIKEGTKIEAYGKLSVYMQRGEYQLNIKNIRQLGIGELQQKFEELKRKLADEGLFSEERKKPVPYLPARIGVVTSPEGAALKDFIKISTARFPSLEIKVYPAPVQGKGAEKKLAAGIKYFNRTADVDVIILTRGGGSLEDLWPFNEEILARAIAASRIPVVSAVGHEIDFTIADFAADLRAPTPSGAAEMIIPDRQAIDDDLNSLHNRMLSAVSLAYERSKGKLERLLSSSALTQPTYMVMEKMQYIDMLLKDMENELESAVRTASDKTSFLEARLNSLSPFNILNRGYSVILDRAGGKIVMSPADAPAGTELKAILAEGEMNIRSE